MALASAFANNFKFLGDASACSKDDMQAKINKVSDWADEYHVPLSVEKSCFLCAVDVVSLCMHMS